MNIALSGRSGSGKSTVATYLGDKYGYKICHPGRYCRLVSQCLFGSIEKELMSEIDAAIRKIDPNVWLRRSLKCNDLKRTVVDGVRYVENYHYLNPLGFSFWLVEAHEEAATRRIEKRDRIIHNPAFRAALGENVADTIPFDAVIQNQGSLQDVYDRVEQILNENEAFSALFKP